MKALLSCSKNKAPDPVGMFQGVRTTVLVFMGYLLSLFNIIAGVTQEHFRCLFVPMVHGRQR